MCFALFWRRLLALTLVAFTLLAVAVAPPADAAPTPTPTPTAAAAPSSTAPNKNVATFGLGPANATKIDGRTSFSYEASPGSQVTDHVGIVNLSLQPLELRLYATDALNDNTGALAYKTAAQTPTDAGAWFKIATPGGSGVLVIAAGATVILPVQLTVPAKASPGDHNAGLAVALVSNIASNQTKNLSLEQRVVAKAYVRVSGPLHPGLSVEKMKTSYSGTTNPFGQGGVTVHYTVHNTGNVNLAGHQRVSISGLLGASASASGIADIPLLLPGGSAPVTVHIKGVWPQILVKGKVTVTPVSAPGAVNPTLHSASASASVWAVPWTLLIVIIVLIAGAGYLIWRRRHPRTPSGRHGPPGQRHGHGKPTPTRISVG